MVHTFNPSTSKAEAGESLSLRPAWSANQDSQKPCLRKKKKTFCLWIIFTLLNLQVVLGFLSIFLLLISTVTSSWFQMTLIYHLFSFKLIKVYFLPQEHNRVSDTWASKGCILPSLKEVLQKCQLHTLDWLHCSFPPHPYRSHLSADESVSYWYRAVEVINYIFWLWFFLLAVLPVSF